jgi:hypothetical protein
MNPEEYMGNNDWKYPIELGMTIVWNLLLLKLSQRKFMRITISTIEER